MFSQFLVLLGLVGAIVASRVLTSPLPLVVVALALFVVTLFRLLWNETIPGILAWRRVAFGGALVEFDVR